MKYHKLINLLVAVFVFVLPQLTRADDAYRQGLSLIGSNFDWRMVTVGNPSYFTMLVDRAIINTRGVPMFLPKSMVDNSVRVSGMLRRIPTTHNCTKDNPCLRIYDTTAMLYMADRYGMLPNPLVLECDIGPTAFEEYFSNHPFSSDPQFSIWGRKIENTPGVVKNVQRCRPKGDEHFKPDQGKSRTGGPYEVRLVDQGLLTDQYVSVFSVFTDKALDLIFVTYDRSYIPSK